MAKYANQNKVLIKRTIPEKGAKKPFLCIYNENIEDAARELSNTEFKLYIYLVSNSNDYSFDYSPQHFANTYGVGLTASREAWRALIKKGYLTESATNSHYYTFTEQPQIKQEPIEIVKEKRGFHLPDGTIRFFTYKELLEINEGDVAETNADWATGIKEG